MPAQELSDDYVAQVLARDAKQTSSKYSVYGLRELLPQRATNTAPKPNTRFLKHIIKETDTHNAALRAKEAKEARVRLGEVKGIDKGSRVDRGYTASDQDRESHRSKRRRAERDDDSNAKHRRRYRRSPSRDSSDRHRHSERHRNKAKDDRFELDEGDASFSARRHHRDRRRRSPSHDKKAEGRLSRSRSESPSPGIRRGDRNRHRARRRDESSDSGARKYDSHKHKRRTPSDHPPPPSRSRNGDRSFAALLKRSPTPSSDSDPLDSIIGPPPPPPEPKVITRGRGVASNSAMDSHFSSNYDPAVDTQLEPDAEMDDWDQALEALRDRQKWQQQGADRLRAAGFSEMEVSKWASKTGGSSAEKDEADVRWRGKGEGREWDRGKVVTSDGVATEADWGRLK